MKAFVFPGKVWPFWSLLGIILALFLVEQFPFGAWDVIKAYLFSPPFFYHSLAIYFFSLVLALFTYRNLYNLKILLAGFLFLLTGFFCLQYFFEHTPIIINFLHILPSDQAHFILYLIYSWNLLLISLVPANMPKSFSRLLLGLLISLEGGLLVGLTRYLVPAMDAYWPWVNDRSMIVLASINGGIILCAHLLSFKRRDVYAWAVTGFLFLFTVAFAARGRDLELLLLLFVPIALAFMVLANLMLSLSHRANYDPLLNIYNRGYGNDLLQGRVRSLGKWYAVVIFDLDRFKRLNDRYGHPAGDRVLYFVAQKIREKALPHGITCRYGGEEFMVVFPNVSLPNATKTANDIVSAVEQMQIPIADKKMAGKKRKKIPKIRVTVSAGVAATRTNKNPLVVVEAADKALYRSKRAGRNRVTKARQVN